MQQKTMSFASAPVGYTPPTDFPDIWGDPRISLDLETHGLNPRRDNGHILGIGIRTDAWDGGYYPIAHTNGENCNKDHVLSWLRDGLKRYKGQITGSDVALFDADYLQCAGIHAPNAKWRDIQWAEPLLDESAFSYGLDALATKYLGQTKQETGMVDMYGPQWKANMQDVHPGHLQDYMRFDLSMPLEILDKQVVALKKEGLLNLYYLECRLAPFLHYMKRTGVRVDLERAQALSAEFGGKISEMSARLNEMAGSEVNFRPSKSLFAAFDKLGIQYPYTQPTEKQKAKGLTVGGPSCTNQWLESQDHEFCKLLATIHEYDKIKGTFVDGYILESNVNGRIHCNFNPLRRADDGGTRGTVSGRFSSTDPNLQNIPVRTDLGKLIRALFIPEPGMLFWSRDYSQIEYRLLVHFAVAAKCKGADVAQKMYIDDPNTDFHMMVSELTGLERKPAKNLNFGLCIAQNEKVLTHKGLVPIEDVTIDMKVWDGVEWVKHEGVIFQGEKEVTTYDGLTATTEHEVWIEDGRKIPIGQAASSLARPRLAVTEIEGNPIGFFDRYIREDSYSSQIRPSGLCRLFNLWKNTRNMGSEYLDGQNEDLSLRQEIQGYSCRPYWEPLRRYAQTLYKSCRSFLEELWWARYSESFYFEGGLHPLCFERIASFGLSEYRCGQAEQRGSLREGQFETFHAQRESKKQTKKVYDILNAGPRRRFTVSGKLVSNCYGMGKEKLARALKVSSEEADKIFAQYHGRAPFIKEIFNKAMKRAQDKGFVTTLLKRRARFNEMEQKPEWMGEGTQRSRTHKSLNCILQGSAADMMKKAMVDIWESGLIHEGGPLQVHLTVHDELDGSVDPGFAGQVYLDELNRLMETALPLLVPVRCDGSVGKNWAEAH